MSYISLQAVPIMCFKARWALPLSSALDPPRAPQDKAHFSTLHPLPAAPQSINLIDTKKVPLREAPSCCVCVIELSEISSFEDQNV